MNCSRSLHGLAAAAACALLTAPAALAASTTTTPAGGENTPLDLGRPSEAVQTGTGGGGIVRTIVGLAVVLGVIYGLHWVLKQVKGSRDTASSGAGLDTISSLQLGPGRSLHLVRAGSEIVLVGTGEHGVTPIRVYSEEEAQRLGLLDGARLPGADGPLDPMHAAPGSPATVRDLVKTVQSWTVRG